MVLSEADYTNEDDTDLVKAIKLKDWAATRKVMDDEIRTLDEFGNTALHAALGFQAPDDILMSLIEQFPEACQMHGSSDWLPLHVAAMFGCSSKVMQALIRAYPQALEDPGEGGIKGRTPRHFSSRFPHNQALLERSVGDWLQDSGKSRQFCNHTEDAVGHDIS